MVRVLVTPAVVNGHIEPHDMRMQPEKMPFRHSTQPPPEFRLRRQQAQTARGSNVIRRIPHRHIKRPTREQLHLNPQVRSQCRHEKRIRLQGNHPPALNRRRRQSRQNRQCRGAVRQRHLHQIRLQQRIRIAHYDKACIAERGKNIPDNLVPGPAPVKPLNQLLPPLVILLLLQNPQHGILIFKPGTIPQSHFKGIPIFPQILHPQTGGRQRSMFQQIIRQNPRTPFTQLVIPARRSLRRSTSPYPNVSKTNDRIVLHPPQCFNHTVQLRRRDKTVFVHFKNDRHQRSVRIKIHRINPLLRQKSNVFQIICQSPYIQGDSILLRLFRPKAVLVVKILLPACFAHRKHKQQ